MVNTDTTKQERMHIQLDALTKLKLERAAAYTQKSLPDFVLGQALHAADEVIHEHETVTLNEADWGVFLDALDDPPKPKAKLKQTFAEQSDRLTVLRQRLGSPSWFMRYLKEPIARRSRRTREHGVCRPQSHSGRHCRHAPGQHPHLGPSTRESDQLEQGWPYPATRDEHSLIAFHHHGCPVLGVGGLDGSRFAPRQARSN